MPEAGPTRCYSYALGRVDSPRRDLVVAFCGDGRAFEDPPAFEDVRQFKLALAAGLVDWLGTKPGAAARRQLKGRISLLDVVALLERGGKRRASLLASLKKHGIHALELEYYPEERIERGWSVEENLVGEPE